MIYTKEEKDNIRLLDAMKKFQVNHVILHVSNSWNHEMAKSKICYYLKQNERKFICEAVFKNGKRADVFDITWGVAYEITYKETRESIERKKKFYPVPLRPLKTSTINNNPLHKLYEFLN